MRRWEDIKLNKVSKKQHAVKKSKPVAKVKKNSRLFPSDPQERKVLKKQNAAVERARKKAERIRRAEKRDEEVLRRAALKGKSTINNEQVSLSEAKSKTVNGFIWRFAEKWGAQAIVFVVSIILAKKVEPSAHGTVALAGVFTTILGVFVDSGMANALIQKKNADDLDFSSMFYFNMAMCLFLYTVMFFAAPLIAKFYGIPELTAMVRVSSLTLVISGLKNVQNAYIVRHMLFKRFFFASLGGTIIAAVVGIVMALTGFGAWAIIAQMLVDGFLDTIILWFTVKWRPKWMFSFLRLKGLFSYGWKLLASSLIDTVYNKLRTLIIGKRYSEASLAFYNKGENFPSLFVSNINTAIDGVLFPTMSKAQDDRTVVRQMTRRSIKTSTYILMPIMMGLAVCAEPAVRILFSEKWLPCVFYLRIFCFSYAFWPIHTANLNAIKAVGRSDIFLKLEIIKKTINIAVIAVTMFISVEAMAWSLIFTSISGQIINSWPNKKLLGYSYLSQLKDMLPSILLSCFMGAIVWSVTLLPISNDWLILAIQVPLGVLIYVLGSKLFKLEMYTYLLDAGKEFLNKKRLKKAANLSMQANMILKEAARLQANATEPEQKKAAELQDMAAKMQKKAAELQKKAAKPEDNTVLSDAIAVTEVEA